MDTVASGILAVVFGILALVFPGVLHWLVGIYLVVIGLLAILGRR